MNYPRFLIAVQLQGFIFHSSLYLFNSYFILNLVFFTFFILSIVTNFIFLLGDIRFTEMKGRGTAIIRFTSERDAQRAVGIL